MSAPLTVNGRTYRRPTRPTVVVCVDGCEPLYVERAAAAGQEVMMNDPRFLRCPTLLAELSQAGARTVVITAKDKLRRLLGHGMQGICFSSEKAAEVTKGEHGIERVTDLVP